MDVLVLVADYPNLNGGIAMNYVHTRNVYYKQLGLNVDILNFSTHVDYKIDELQVYTLNSVRKSSKKYDILVCHAPNLRNHALFLFNYSSKFKKIVFFFHGHEVLRSAKVYPQPYSYLKKSWATNAIKDIYDVFKLRVWRTYFSFLLKKSHFVFVSNWMYNEFTKWVKLSIPPTHCSIIYNSIGQAFESSTYNLSVDKNFDFISVRAFIDGSKYAVDIINNIAFQNPSLSFLLIGKGKYFDYNTKAENITWIDAHLSHTEILDYLNASKCALMPTRTDAQGLMMCEMASFGIPLITSDLLVCREVLSDFKNVALIDNDDYDNDLFLSKLGAISKYAGSKENHEYYKANTINNEFELFNKLLK